MFTFRVDRTNNLKGLKGTSKSAKNRTLHKGDTPLFYKFINFRY